MSRSWSSTIIPMMTPARWPANAAAGDARVTVIDAPDLPDGWFGKQWACHSGFQQTTGSLLLFTDADTRHAPDLVATPGARACESEAPH